MTTILSMIIILSILSIFIILVYNYYGRNGRLINRIPGPPGYPIIENFVKIIGYSREEQWKFLMNLFDQYYPIYKIWGIYFPIVFIRHPDDLKTILNSPKHISKETFIYETAYSWLRTGLATSSGAKWHSQRKILSPAFHFNILQQFDEILKEEGENMIKSLKNTEGPFVKDLIPFVGECALNTTCETVMGISLRNIDENQQRKYREAVHQMEELYIYRLLRPWLHNDWIFSLVSKGRKQREVIKILHEFTDQVIEERKLYHERTNNRFLKNLDNSTKAAADDAEMIGIKRKRLALLDLLIAAFQEGILTNINIKEQVNTFMFAGYDTSMIAISFLLAILAEHKDIQNRVRKEIDTVMQENGGKFTTKSFQSLPYFERCIKEAMRLYPSVFVISRRTEEDVKLQSYLVPHGTILLLNIYGVHRDPNFWPNPEIFDPDRFLPEKIRNCHPYSYIPFSSGPRSCIGQRFAMMQIKAIAAPLINNFYLEPVDYLKNLRLEIGITLHPSHPLRVRFVPICK